MRTKNILMAAPLLASLFALGACTNTDDFAESTSENKAEIAFANPFISKTTRSTGDIKDAAALQNFKVKVWGEKYASTGDYVSGDYVFNGTELTYNAATQKWEHNITPAPKWETGKDFDFVGFAPANAAANVAYNEGKIELTGVPVLQRVTNDNGENVGDDYLLSGLTTSKSGNLREDVSLNFNHILSRLSVYTYTTLDNATYKVEISKLSLYLPNSTLSASYKEYDHSGPVLGNDTWTWEGFTNANSNAASSSELGGSYEAADFVAASSPLTVNYAQTASTTTANVFANKNYFIAPTPTGESVNFFLVISYTITKNATDANPDGTDKKTYTKFVNIAELTQLKQGYQHNLFIGIMPTAIKFNVESVEGWKENVEGNDNFVDAEGHSFAVSNMKNDAANHQVIGVINSYGNVKVGSSNTDITYQLAKVSNEDGTFTKENLPITILGWYSDAACTGEPSIAPSITNRYAKFAWDYSKTTIKAGKYSFTFKNNMNDKVQGETLDLTEYIYNPTSNGNGGLNGFEGVDM